MLNLLGLVVGLASFILLAFYVQYEYSFDRQHSKADRIYRIAQTQEGNTFRGTDHFAVSPLQIAPSLVEENESVTAGTVITTIPYQFLSEGINYIENGLFADDHFFSVFDHEVIDGDVQSALQNLGSIIVTESLAQKYFGDESAVGQKLYLSNDSALLVQAIIADVPANQHFDFDFIISIERYGEFREDRAEDRWSSNNYHSYIVLEEGASISSVEKTMLPYGERAAAELARFDLSIKPKYYLQPLTAIHLHSKINAEIGATGDITRVRLAIAIAFILLLLALFNYANIQAARSTQRGVEVGIRKVLGAGGGQIVRQLLTESTLLIGLSLLLAWTLAHIFTPQLEELLGSDFATSLSQMQPIFWKMLFCALLAALSISLYPAILSSLVSPVVAMAGTRKHKKTRIPFVRNALVIGQFTAAIVLAIAAVVVYQQLDYIKSKKLGYDREQVVFVPYRNYDLLDKCAALKAELLRHPSIQSITHTNNLPINTFNQGPLRNWEGKGSQANIPFYRMYTDENLLDVYKIGLAQGRFFDRQMATDTSNAYLINRAALSALGWTEAIGKEFRDGHVIGVLEDFHFQPLDLGIEPMWIAMQNSSSSYFSGFFSIRMEGGPLEDVRDHIESSFEEIIPGIPANVQFVDDSYEDLYASESALGKLFAIFTLLAIFVACLGLLGLATQHVLERTKEIGIRKILGASTSWIFTMITRDFIMLIFVAAAIAIPIAYFGMSSWLEDFTYRIPLSPLVFVLVPIAAAAFALITISTQAIRAANLNPIHTIKES